ncbi:Na+/H+ antiporter NhaA, partial [Agrococcus casei]
ALVYLAIAGRHEGLSQGWAIPTATDIAFAVAVLAIIGSHLPSPLRIFLLTLAVVDDLLAISIIAIFYTDEIQFMPLGTSIAIIIVYGLLAHLCRKFFATRMWAAWLILLPLGILAWVFMHESGIHATIAGVLLGFAVPVFAKGKTDAPGLAEEFEHRFRPLSAGVAVPIFAFFAAGVSVGGVDGFIAGFTEPVTIAIMAALILGKPIGISLVTFIANKAMGRSLDPSYKWIDLLGVGLLAGIGFTVSLLVTELSFDSGDPVHDLAKAGVLKASVLAAILAGILLSVRNRHYKKIAERDAIDADDDGTPDVYQRQD